MKIIDYDGKWVGLTDFIHEYSVDWFSTPDNLKFGFDIVYRLIFKLDEIQIKDMRLRENFVMAFKKSFDLDDGHYEVNQWNGGSVFWRVYWDRGAFDLRILKRCEENLNTCAENNKIQVILLSMVIIPRSLENISELIKFNANK